jgi:hypothetical protein
MSAEPRSRRGRLVGLLVAVVLVLVALAAAGARIPSPQLAVGRSAPVRWAGAHDPASVAIGVIRLAALAAALELLGAVLLELAVERRPRAASRPMRLPLATDLVRRVVGLGLTASLAVGPAATARASTPSGVVRMHLVTDGPAPVMHVRGAPPPPAALPTRPAPSLPAATWTIAPGDHLWHVATATLERAWGRAPSDSAIAAYVVAITRANAAVFVVPGNADLVYPGQRFVLPPPPPR